MTDATNLAVIVLFMEKKRLFLLRHLSTKIEICKFVKTIVGYR